MDDVEAVVGKKSGLKLSLQLRVTHVSRQRGRAHAPDDAAGLPVDAEQVDAVLVEGVPGADAAGRPGPAQLLSEHLGADLQAGLDVVSLRDDALVAARRDVDPLPQAHQQCGDHEAPGSGRSSEASYMAL